MTKQRLINIGAALLLVSAALPPLAQPANAQKAAPISVDDDDNDNEAPARPWQGEELPPVAPTNPGDVEREELPHNLIDRNEVHVERDTLAPIGAAEGTAYPASAWTTTDPAALEARLAKTPAALKSWALSRALLRLLESDPTAASGPLLATRARLLEEMGLSADALKLLNATSGAPVTTLVRLEIAAGDAKSACNRLASESVSTAGFETAQKIEAALLAGYCAAFAKDKEQAGIAAGIARDLSGGRNRGADFLDSIASDTAPRITKGAPLSVLEYRILELKGGADAAAILDAASPALLITLARSETSPDDLRLPAAERAARLGLVSTADLAAAYRMPHPGGTADTIERAALFKRIEAENTPLKKARLIRAFLDEAHRQNMHVAGYLLMMTPIQALAPSQELDWFAETAIEVSLLSARFDTASRWAEAFAANEKPRPGTSGSVALWRALIEIASPRAQGSPRDVSGLAALAAPNAVKPDLMWRLSTSLDALDIGIPQALWDARSSLTEPTTGHLPDTGVLSELKAASDRREIASTLLLTIAAVGPEGAEGAHIISLGDSVRALRRAGLDEEARAVALEALLPVWPRIVVE